MQTTIERLATRLDRLLRTEARAGLLAPSDLRRIRAVGIASLLFVPVGIPFVLQYWHLGVPQMSLAVVAAIAGGIANLLLLRRTHNASRCANLATALMFFLLLASNMSSGGFYDPNFAWLYVTPVMAFLLAGFRSGWAWTGVILTTTVAFWVLPELGVHVPDLIPAEMHAAQSLANRLSNVLGLSLLTTAFLVAQRRAEEELAGEIRIRRRAEEAANGALRAKADFLATMSHEIRTPMNGVFGMLDILLDGPLAAEQRECALVARRSALGLLTILNDILDFSKIESGALVLETIDFDLAAVIEEAMQVVRPTVKEKDLVVRCVIDPDLPRVLRGDPVRLRQVLLNLLGNAVKFTTAGSVEVEVRRVADDASTLTLRASVRDTGIGIAPEALSRLFESFVQGDASTTRRYGGTGLGLAIVKRLAAAMAGAVGVESTPGEGSTFWFSARLQRAGGQAPSASDACPAAAAWERPDRGAPPVVLVAEDHEVNQRVARSLLESLGVAVDIVATGREAVEAVGRRHYDLVFMDLHMPDLDGFDATVEIRRRENAGRRIPIVALTASVLAEDRERCRAAGLDDLVSKPISSDALASALKRWFPRVSPIAPPCRADAASA